MPLCGIARKCLLRNRRHRSRATRRGRIELAPSPINDPVPKARRHQRTAQGMPPVRRLRRPTPHRTRAERDLRVRGRYGSAEAWGREPRSQASRSRNPPWSAPMDLPGPSAQVGHGPHTGDERHRSARAQSRRSGGPGWAFGSLPAPAPSPMATPGSATRRGRAWLRGVPGVQETARSAVSCTGLRGASSHSTVFLRVASLRHGIQL